MNIDIANASKPCSGRFGVRGYLPLYLGLT
jgi:hypothetical protein